MWQFKNLQSNSVADDSKFTQRQLSIGSTQPVPGGRKSIIGSQDLSRHSTAFSNATTMFSGTSATSVMVGSRGNGTAILLPELPVILVFTTYEGKYAFLHFECMYCDTWIASV